MSLADRLRKWARDLSPAWRKTIRSEHEQEHVTIPERGRSETESLDAERAPSAMEAGTGPTVPVEPSPAPASEQRLTRASDKASGRSDNLTAIRGIGASTQARLNAAGIWSFDQLAQSTPSEVRKALHSMGRRPAVEKWIRQARELVGHGSR